jgi:hypothetical protein
MRIRGEPVHASRLRHLSNGQEHPHFTALLLVFLAKRAEKIPLLELACCRFSIAFSSLESQ